MKVRYSHVVVCLALIGVCWTSATTGQAVPPDIAPGTLEFAADHGGASR